MGIIESLVKTQFKKNKYWIILSFRKITGSVENSYSHDIIKIFFVTNGFHKPVLPCS